MSAEFCPEGYESSNRLHGDVTFKEFAGELPFGVTFADDVATLKMQSIFTARDPNLRVSPFPFRAGLEMLSRAGVTELVINNDLGDWHVYGQQELDWMRDGVTPGQ